MTSFHVLFCHLYVFFDEMSINVFGPFLIRLFSYCWVLKSSLYIMDSSPLSNVQVFFFLVCGLSFHSLEHWYFKTFYCSKTGWGKGRCQALDWALEAQNKTLPLTLIWWPDERGRPTGEQTSTVYPGGILGTLRWGRPCGKKVSRLCCCLWV